VLWNFSHDPPHVGGHGELVAVWSTCAWSCGDGKSSSIAELVEGLIKTLYVGHEKVHVGAGDRPKKLMSAAGHNVDKDTWGKFFCVQPQIYQRWYSD
jgi:hypothetical protein